MVKILIISSPRVSENCYKNFDKARMKLLPNFTRHHLITLTNHVQIFHISALNLHADARFYSYENSNRLLLNQGSFVCMSVVCLFYWGTFITVEYTPAPGFPSCDPVVPSPPPRVSAAVSESVNLKPDPSLVALVLC